MSIQKPVDPQKQVRLDKFVKHQQELKQLLSSCPSGCQNWFYQKSINFKKAVKDCDKFLKLKPTDDPMSGIKLENQLTKVKEFYK